MPFRLIVHPPIPSDLGERARGLVVAQGSGSNRGGGDFGLPPAMDRPGKVSAALATMAAVKLTESEVEKIPEIKEMLSLEQAEQGALSEIYNMAKKMEEGVNKVRTDGVKEPFAKLCDYINFVVNGRAKLRKARRAVINLVKMSMDKAAEEVHTKSLAEKMDDIAAAVASQGEKIDAQNAKIAELTTPMEGRRTTWSEVAKKKVTKTLNQENPAVQVNGRRPLRAKNPAILVKANTEDFPALAKRLKKDASREVTGDRVVGMRQTRSGDMLIEVNGDAQKLEEVRSEIERVAGAGITVSALTQRGVLEIRDIDCWSDKTDVAEAIVTQTPAELGDIKILNMRPVFGGTLTAVVQLPVTVAHGLASTGSLRIGFVMCRTRMAEARPRCFKCFQHGHMAGSCLGKNREKCCRRCGIEGHFVMECTSPLPMVEAFRVLLEAERRDSKPESGSDEKRDNAQQAGVTHHLP